MTPAEFRAMTARAQDEHALQLEVTAWLEANLPASIPWTAVDHAAKLGARQGGQRKRRGVKRGQPDYRFILPPHGRSAEIELKRPVGGRQSPDQRAWEACATGAGGFYVVCRSLNEVQVTLTAWGVFGRGRAVA